MSALNSVLNRIHEWGQPENHPLKRIVLTRAGGVAAISLEAVSLVVKPFVLGFQSLGFISKLPLKVVKWIVHSEKLNAWDEKLPGSKDLIHTVKRIYQYFVGLLSSAFFGVVFSPELNFRLHLKLGLAIDQLADRKKKDLEAILSVETKGPEILPFWNEQTGERLKNYQTQLA